MKESIPIAERAKESKLEKTKNLVNLNTLAFRLKRWTSLLLVYVKKMFNKHKIERWC